MQEMIELSKQQTNLPATEAKAVRYKLIGGPEEDVLDVSKTIFAGPAQFGRELGKGFSVSGPLILAEPIEACQIPELIMPKNSGVPLSLLDEATACLLVRINASWEMEFFICGYKISLNLLKK